MNKETRIKEIVFKDGSKEYYPQIKIEKPKDAPCNAFETEDGWMWVRKEQFVGSRYELRANDYKCVCATKEDAVEVIRLYNKQIRDIEESNKLYFEKKQKREDFVEETNFLEI